MKFRKLIMVSLFAFIFLIEYSFGLSPLLPESIYIECTPNLTYISQAFNISTDEIYSKYVYIEDVNLRICGNNETVYLRIFSSPKLFFERYPEWVNKISKICLENITPVINYIKNSTFEWCDISTKKTLENKIGEAYIECSSPPRSTGSIPKPITPSLYKIFYFVFIFSLATTIVLFKKFRDREKLLRLSTAILLFLFFTLISGEECKIGFPIVFFEEFYCGPMVSLNNFGGYSIYGSYCGTPWYFSILFVAINILFFYGVVYLLEKLYLRTREKLSKSKYFKLVIFPLIGILFLSVITLKFCGDFIRYPCKANIPFIHNLLVIYLIWVVVVVSKYLGDRYKNHKWLIYSAFAYCIWLLVYYIGIINKSLEIENLILITGYLLLLINPLSHLDFMLKQYIFKIQSSNPFLMSNPLLFFLSVFTSFILLGFVIHKIKQLLRRIKKK